MKSIVFGLGVGVLAASSLAAPRQARACGGCFARPTENTIVTDHRMAFSVSPVQTVLWDQIKYTGNPSAFSWVLPVRRGAVVQLSHDEWFAALDATTSPIIYGPTPNCGGGGAGCGFAGSSNASSASADFGGSVQVINQSVVGPYDTVTLRSTDPHALETWLVANDFTIPGSIRPTIAAYVTGGFDFIALRLQPGQGVQSMQPVRIVTPGADVTLPLRMVAAGVGAQVGITLFVISEGRYEARPPFTNAVVDDSKLVWLHAQGRSNYQETSQALMQGNRGRTWLTESASPVSLVLSSLGVSCVSGGFNGSAFPGQSLADVYSGQCSCNPVSDCGRGAGGGVTDAALDGMDADASGDASYLPLADATDAMGEGTEAAAEAAAADATGATVDGASSADANASAGDAPAGEAGEGPESGACTGDPCAGFDDLDVASVGMHEGAAWITRLRAVLPTDALGEGDLHIQASASQTAIPRTHNVNRYDDATYSPCPPSGGCSASAARPGLVERGLVAGAFGFVAIAFLRRRARRHLH